MATNYPNALDDTSDLIDNATNSTVTKDVHAAAHNNVADTLIAIETELGTDPKGTYADVKTRLNDGVVKSPSANQIIEPTGDDVGLSVQASASQNISALIDVRNNAGTILGFWDRNGNLSAAGFKVSGTALASTHLSDSSALARLAGPTLTGIPAAPTASAGTNTTQLATTAFVQTAIAGLTTAFNTQTSSYTLVLADENKLVEMNLSTANTVTVPLNASVAYPVGTTITIAQLGTGQTTLTATGGVTLKSYNNNLKIGGQYGIASIIKRGTDDWWVAGNLVP